MLIYFFDRKFVSKYKYIHLFFIGWYVNFFCYTEKRVYVLIWLIGTLTHKLLNELIIFTGSCKSNYLNDSFNVDGTVATRRNRSLLRNTI